MRKAGRCFVAALCFCMVLLIGNLGVAIDQKTPLADKHKALGLSCDACHGTGKKKAVPMEKCLGCHESYPKVAERTKQLEPNPHDNHLVDLECSKCHQGHKPQVNYCQTCHADMEFRKP
jgi:fumarate reductase flavoprotein subunit